MVSNLPDRNTFRILISSDNHLGYKENHPIRGNDSFDAFEEIIDIAKENNVDFLLLGGDLFHELNPSQRCLFKTVSLLEKNIFGDKPISFLINNYVPNYCNENMNISLPIFIIHGNHDYPATEESISAIDILSSCNLINYFGKQKEIDEIVIDPILFQKGSTKIALYGLGHVKDIKLHQCFQRGKVRFVNPPSEGYFSIFVLHQNRYKGVHSGVPTKNCIHPKMIPSFINLVIWGHEHESIPNIIENSEQGFYIYQPGSSAITSLIAAEAEPKHVGIIEVNNGEFIHKPVFLKRTRPLLFNSIELQSLFDSEIDGVVKDQHISVQEAWIAKKLEAQIEEMIFRHDQNPKPNKMLPIVRVKVEYSGFDILRTRNIEAKFQGRVANEGEILKMWKKVVNKPKNDRSLLNNSRLNSRFEETIFSKESFGSLLTDANESIRTIFQQLLEEEHKQPRIIHLSSLFDRIPEINIRNSYQILEEVINENNITKGLIARVSKDFVINTNNFIGGTSQFIEKNYQDTNNQGDNLKFIDKQHDIPYLSLKANILELTQELSLRSDHINSKSSTASERQDLQNPIASSIRKEQLDQNQRKNMFQYEESKNLVNSEQSNRNFKEKYKMEQIEEEKSGFYHNDGMKHQISSNIQASLYLKEDDDSEDSIFDDEFGKCINQDDSNQRKIDSNSMFRVGYQLGSQPKKESLKRKAIVPQSSNSYLQQGKKIRNIADLDQN